MNNPIQIGAEIIVDGEGVRQTVTTPSTTQSFVMPTDLIPQVCEMLMQRYRGAVAMRAALAPPATAAAQVAEAARAPSNGTASADAQPPPAAE